jgi:hypothetical protein
MPDQGQALRNSVQLLHCLRQLSVPIVNFRFDLLDPPGPLIEVTA